jgi:endo-1,4-beta-xylanase
VEQRSYRRDTQRPRHVVELTEVDIILRGTGDEATRLERQRQDYFDMASVCLAVEACERMTLWGFTDRHTWIDSVG